MTIKLKRCSLNAVWALILVSSGVTAGPAVPSYWTGGAPNAAASHWMRMTPDRMMDPTEILRQHHIGAPNASPGSFDPSLSAITAGGGPGEDVTVRTPAVTGTGEPHTKIRVEMMTMNTPNDYFASVTSAMDHNGNALTPVGGLTTVADQPWQTGVFDFSWQDFIVSPGTDWTDIQIAANSGNIMQFWVWSVQAPIPAAVWLFGTGLVGLVGISRRKQVGQST